jgi:hypothetical protein
VINRSVRAWRRSINRKQEDVPRLARPVGEAPLCSRWGASFAESGGELGGVSRQIPGPLPWSSSGKDRQRYLLGCE